MNLRTRQLTISMAEVWRLDGDPNRTELRMQVTGNHSFDIAFVSHGTTPSPEAWTDGMLSKDSSILNIATVADIWIRNSAGGTRALAMLSDTPFVLDTV